MIKAVIFDFGRVISAQKPEALFRGYERELQLHPGTINTIMFSSEAWQDALLGRKSMEEFWMIIGPQLGLHSARQIDAFRERYYADERINPQVRDLIGRLFGKYKLAVCSNSPPGLAQWLVDWAIEHFFDVIFCSGDEGIAKPDADAFLRTVARLEIEPSEAAFVDDTLENVQAASQLGLTGIHFTNGPALERDLSMVLPPPGLNG